MSIRITFVFVLLAALGLVTESARAHGGQFQGPGGAVPPGLKEPDDPTPPPPPPSTGQPPVTGNPGNTPPTGNVPGPTPTTTPKMSTPGAGKRPTRGAKQLTYADWSFWYVKNRDPIENLKDAIYYNVGSGSGIYWLGGARVGNRDDSTHMTRAAVQADVIPALLWAMDPENAKDPDVESASYIALGKVARDMASVDTMKAALAPRSGRDRITRESAALALGLLRRSEEDLQFASADLDRVRLFLFDVLEDDDRVARERGFAALSIGLLGDQPTGSRTSAGAWDAKATTARLFSLLDVQHENRDVPVGVLVAIGMQPPTSFDDGTQRDVLRDAVIRGRLFSRKPDDVVRAWCAQALGSIGTRKDVGVLQRVLATRKASRLVKRSAAIGLGKLSGRVSGTDRVELVDTLIESLDDQRDPSTRCFGWISVAQALIHDIEAGRSDVIKHTKAGERLIDVAEKSKWIERPYGALALALVGRAITDEASDHQHGAWRKDAIETLRSGFQDERMDARDRSAFALALGMVRDRTSVFRLTDVIEDRKAAPELRGYAAVAIGLIGMEAPRHATRVIRKALKERRSEEMRIHCATALGLLHDRGAVKLLLEELEVSRSAAVKGQVVLALAQIGDDRAVRPLVDLLKNPKEQDLTRALACAGLGVVGDLESTPSLARLRNGANYRAMTELLLEAFSII